MMHKKEYIGCLMVLVLMYAWALPGCGKQEGVFYGTAQAEKADGDVFVEDGADGRTNGDVFVEDGACEGTAPPVSASQDGWSIEPLCYVHICGAVMHPGVYEVPEGSRLYEVILLAGGLCADACDYLVNQAQAVSDGMQVYIQTVQEAQEKAADQTLPAGTDLMNGQEAGSQDRRINLNSATKEELMTLPGVGGTRAQAIIDYREESGGFSCVEDLMKVSGIKQGVFDRLKDLIKV